MLAASPGDAAKIAIEIRRQGMKQQLLGSGALVGDEFLKSGGNAVEGAITAAQFWRENPDPKAHAYLAALEKRTGEPPVLHERVCLRRRARHGGGDKQGRRHQQAARTSPRIASGSATRSTASRWSAGRAPGR